MSLDPSDTNVGSRSLWTLWPRQGQDGVLRAVADENLEEPWCDRGTDVEARLDQAEDASHPGTGRGAPDQGSGRRAKDRDAAAAFRTLMIERGSALALGGNRSHLGFEVVGVFGALVEFVEHCAIILCFVALKDSLTSEPPFDSPRAQRLLDHRG
jgi:hypothetical protein